MITNEYQSESDYAVQMDLYYHKFPNIFHFIIRKYISNYKDDLKGLNHFEYILENTEEKILKKQLKEEDG